MGGRSGVLGTNRISRGDVFGHNLPGERMSDATFSKWIEGAVFSLKVYK